MDSTARALALEATRGTIDLAGHRTNQLLANEYVDFIEFLQEKFGYEEVKEMQKEFDAWNNKPTKKIKKEKKDENEKFLKNIKPENLKLIPKTQWTIKNLEKLLEWQMYYADQATWEDFDNNYWQCSLCGTYTNESTCICYAR